MNNNDIIRNSLLANPENAFTQADLNYKGSEIMDIYYQFDLAATPLPAYQWGKDLLYATRGFRLSTKPQGMFAKFRAETQTDEELQAIFSEMYDALQVAEQHLAQPDISAQDKKILLATLQYCKASISQRIASLQAGDKLLKWWPVSELKKSVDA